MPFKDCSIKTYLDDFDKKVKEGVFNSAYIEKACQQKIDTYIENLI